MSVSQNQNTRLRLFFSSTLYAPFVEEDDRILSRHFTVDKLIAAGVEAVLRIPWKVARAEVTFTWLGSIYAAYTVFWAKLLGRKSIIVIGGVDASKEEAINYGIWLSPWKSFLLTRAFRNADRLLTVDPFFENEVARLAEYNGSNAQTVPTGYDAMRWKPGGAKTPMVLTVAACHDTWRMKKKGIGFLLAVARRMPDIPFCIIGLHPRLVVSSKRDVPPNVELVPYVPRAEVLPHYQKAKVYCQPSYTEGLPNAICEAMLCGCIPVGTAVGGIPTAIGDVGFLVKYGDEDGLIAALEKALAAPESAGESARQRIATGFTLARRERALVDIVNGLVK